MKKLCILSVLTIATSSQAGVFENPIYQTLQEQVRTFKGGLLDLKPDGLNLLQKGKWSSTEAIRQHLSRKGIRVRGSGLSLTNRSPFETFTFEAGDFPICRLMVKTRRMSDGTLIALGRSPSQDIHIEPRAEDWAPKYLVRDTLASHFSKPIDVHEWSPCVLLDGVSWYPVWDVHVDVDGLPYKALVDGYEVHQSSARFFDASGVAHVHESNVLEGEKSTFSLTDLEGDGSLTSEFLVNIPNGVAAVNESDHIYNYEVTDSKYDQVAAYAYAQKHHDYMASIGFEWYGPKPMEVRIHERPKGETNNALFMPAESASVTKPTIFVGDGDGILLRNLPKDGDVISHEYGHHVVYRTLKETSGESLVLHEGLADFFTFARTGDTCLGESICPEGSGACQVEAQCLRTADNDLTYGSSEYENAAGHLKGQLVSGMLWDLKDAIPINELAKLTNDAVSYLVSDSGLSHFLLSMLNADKELNECKYKADILAAFEERGLKTLIEDDLEGSKCEFPTPEEKDEIEKSEENSGNGKKQTDGESSSKGESKGGDNIFGCSVSRGATSLSALLNLLVAFAPFASVFRRRRP